MAQKEVAITGGTILGIFILVGAIIIAAQKAFYLFASMSVFFLAIGVAASLIEFFVRDHDFTEWHEYFSVYLLGAFLIFGLLSIPMYLIGFGLGGTVIGQASVQTHDAITGAEQQISDTMKQSINQIVSENCKVLDENNCNLLKQTASTAMTLQEVSDRAIELKELAGTAQKISNKIN